MKHLLVFVLVLLGGVVSAQLPPPNEAGVSMGHLHLLVRDVAAQRRLWIEGLGATPVMLGKMEMLKFPDVVVALRKGEPTGGTEGSVIDHLGFRVRNLQAALDKWKAAGGVVSDYRPNPNQAFLIFPEDIKVELTEDPSMSVPIAHHHIHFFDASVDQTKAWYVKMFGAKPGRRGKFEAADLPGVNLSFSAAKTPTVGSKGRAVDHIGFEVKNLEAFCKKLEGQGVKFDSPYRKIPSLGIAVAFLTDPWGTYIELTEGLNRL
jgi:catechol 2,3-dioxygenase-like lactoylglutathione lyase family enzyme